MHVGLFLLEMDQQLGILMTYFLLFSVDKRTVLFWDSNLGFPVCESDGSCKASQEFSSTVKD